MRYAVYFIPEPGTELARFGAAWLGRDIESGQHVAQRPTLDFSEEELRAVTAEPRRYGFHATLKPPFSLERGCTETQFLNAVASLADHNDAFTLPSLHLFAIGRFLALVPTMSCPRIMALAESCVSTLDEFRARPSDEELSRRRAAGLTARQDALLERWGYPYVFDEYRFHMTLTASLEPTLRERLMPTLGIMTAPFANDPVSLASLSVVVEPSPGSDFYLLKQFPLRMPR